MKPLSIYKNVQNPSDYIKDMISDILKNLDKQSLEVKASLYNIEEAYKRLNTLKRLHPFPFPRKVITERNRIKIYIKKTYKELKKQRNFK